MRGQAPAGATPSLDGARLFPVASGRAQREQHEHAPENAGTNPETGSVKDRNGRTQNGMSSSSAPAPPPAPPPPLGPPPPPAIGSRRNRPVARNPEPPLLPYQRRRRQRRRQRVLR